ARAVTDDAHRGRAARRVAREHVPAAPAPTGEQALTGGAPALDLGGVGGMVGDDRTPRVLLVPAKCGHVPVAAQQEAGLAGAGLRGEIALPTVQSVRALRQPAGD